jgi:hypothetical protein
MAAVFVLLYPPAAEAELQADGGVLAYDDHVGTFLTTSMRTLGSEVIRGRRPETGSGS